MLFYFIEKFHITLNTLIPLEGKKALHQPRAGYNKVEDWHRATESCHVLATHTLSHLVVIGRNAPVFPRKLRLLIHIPCHNHLAFLQTLEDLRIAANSCLYLPEVDTSISREINGQRLVLLKVWAMA